MAKNIGKKGNKAAVKEKMTKVKDAAKKIKVPKLSLDGIRIPAPGAKKEGGKTVKSKKGNSKIGYKLILAFCVPVLLIVALGTVSYNLSVKRIKKQYEQSVMDTVASMSLNCNLLCENVQNKAAEFASNEYIQAYYTKSYKADAAEAQSCYRSVQTVLTSVRGTSSYIAKCLVKTETVLPQRPAIRQGVRTKLIWKQMKGRASVPVPEMKITGAVTIPIWMKIPNPRRTAMQSLI